MNDEKTELLPCEHCGSDNVTTITMVYFTEGYERYYATCYDCGCSIGLMDEGDGRAGAYFDTEAEAIAAWNTRAELVSGTCKVSKPNCSDFFNLCSECGEQWSQVSAPKFCPNCGKAVKR